MTDFFEGHVKYVSATCKVRLFLRLRKWILIKFSLSNHVKRTDQALNLALTLCGRIQSLVSSLHSHGTYTVNSKAFFATEGRFLPPVCTNRKVQLSDDHLTPVRVCFGRAYANNSPGKPAAYL